MAWSGGFRSWVAVERRKHSGQPVGLPVASRSRMTPPRRFAVQRSTPLG